MFAFGAASTKRLNTCHPDIVRIMRRALELSDIDFTIVCGYRGEEEQEAAFDAGNSKAHYGESPHNVEPAALAVDVAPFFEGMIQWNDKELFAELAKAIHRAQNELHDKSVISNKLENGFEKWGWDAPHWQVIGWKGKR